MIWKLPIFTSISTLNFFISWSSQIFVKIENNIDVKTISFHPYDTFILINVCPLDDIKKFNMDMLVKIGSFQIKQNILDLKSTLVKMTTNGGREVQKYQKFWPRSLWMTPKRTFISNRWWQPLPLAFYDLLKHVVKNVRESLYWV